MRVSVENNDHRLSAGEGNVLGQWPIVGTRTTGGCSGDDVECTERWAASEAAFRFFLHCDHQFESMYDPSQ
eukprot:1292639-Pyramimonas_sp.AAC.1